jgi:hypothetical protein
MKPLLLLLGLAITQSTIAQFGKVSAGAIIPKEGEAVFNAMVSGGVKIGEALHLGASFGYYKFKDVNKPVIPVGLEFSFFDQSKELLTPYFVLAAYYPGYNDQSVFTSSGLILTTNTKGVFQYKAGAGVGFPITKVKRLIVSCGYTPAKFKSTIKTVTYGPSQPSRTRTTETSSTSDLFFVTIEYAF